MAGTVAFAALWYWLPTTLQRGTGRITREFRVLKDVAALVALGMSALAAISMFATMTYIAPLLTDVTGIKASSITLFLLVYGLGLTVGSHLGGRLSKGYLFKPLVRLMIGTIVLLLGFIVALPYFWSALTLLFLWGAISFAIMPMLQLLIVDQSVEAPNLASTLNQSAFNLGTWAGGVWVGRGLSLQYLPALSAAFMAVAAVTAYGAKRLFARHAAEIGDTALQYAPLTYSGRPQEGGGCRPPPQAL